MSDKVVGCPFCYVEDTDIIWATESWFAIYDRYPVTESHILIIPKRHVQTFLELSDAERYSFGEIYKEMVNHIHNIDESVEGHNLGCNVGEVAGQSVSHFHFHMIPRRKDDVSEPRGGIRGVFPDKQDYNG